MDFEFDIALSFAEEDRNAALALALALEIETDANVYYYPNNYASTWGEQIEKKLTEIYSTKSKYAVLFLSKKYLSKKFTQVELSAVRARMKDSPNRVYMLPVLLEPIDSLNDVQDITEMGFLSWGFAPKKIAKELVKLLGKKKTDAKNNETKSIVISQKNSNTGIATTQNNNQTTNISL